MKQLLFLPLLAIFSIFCISSCTKKTADPPPVLIDERIEITPTDQAVLVGENVQFEVKLFDNMGNLSTKQLTLTWSSTDETIATISANGTATGLSKGQVQINVQYLNLTATALLNVLEKDQPDEPKQIASINITPSEPVFLLLNEELILSAEAKDIDNEVLPDVKEFNWRSSDGNIVSVSETGLVKALDYGQVEIIAESGGIQSSPTIISIGKQGTFQGKNGYNVAGTVTLKATNDNLELNFLDDFSASDGPDVRIYLSKSIDNINQSLELATLNSNGAQSYNLPADVSITEYRYVVIWCKQFGVLFGNADLGE
jgi:hypothetical protein